MAERLDRLIVLKYPGISRSKAQEFIKGGRVQVGEKLVNKPSTLIDESAQIDIEGLEEAFVSRAGEKLAAAIENFRVDVREKVCLDIGASSGGFTQCLLKNGASKVYALDVGTLQLSPKLKGDERVVSMEKTNCRYIEKSMFDSEIDFVSCDVSFISLRLVIPAICKVLDVGKEAVLLLKPQFEVGKDEISKSGVVKDEKTRLKVLSYIKTFLIESGFNVMKEMQSPIKGGKGNIEYLLYIMKTS